MTQQEQGLQLAEELLHLSKEAKEAIGNAWHPDIIPDLPELKLLYEKVDNFFKLLISDVNDHELVFNLGRLVIGTYTIGRDLHTHHFDYNRCPYWKEFAIKYRDIILQKTSK